MNTAHTARFDLTIGREEKEIIARAAALMGTTMAAFIRFATTQKAREIVNQESSVTMSARDFQEFVSALESAPAFNANLQRARQAVQEVRRV